jgi:hypothetical protein
MLTRNSKQTVLLPPFQSAAAGALLLAHSATATRYKASMELATQQT